MGTLGHEQKFEMPSLKRLLSEAESTFDFYLKTPLKGVTQMIGWPFSKSEDDDSDEENRHSASSEEDCEEMKKKYGWELKRVEQNDDDSKLSVDCVFKGKQTSFWDMWGDHQDDDNKDEA